MEKAIKVLEARVKEYIEIGTEPALQYAESCQKLIDLGRYAESIRVKEPEKVNNYDGEEVINHLY